MTENRKRNIFYIFLVFLDLKCEGQASLVEAKVDLNDGSSTGTNNK